MANRFIGGILSSKQPQSSGFVSRASTGTYFNNLGQLTTAPANQPRLNYNFTGQLAANRYSALFTSTSTNYLSTVTAASALGTGDFTMEFWWKANSTTQSNYSNVINQGFTGSPANGAFSFKVYSTSNILNFTYYNGGISDNSTTANVNDLAWHHIAASRAGTSLNIYVDGAFNTTITLPASFNMGASGGTTYIGYNPRDASYINGHVKDLRLITGQALYTGAFTPPTAPLTRTTVGSTGAGAAATLSGTVLLLTCQTASFSDASSNNYTITNTNAVTASLLLPNSLGIDTSGTGWSQPAILLESSATNGHPRSQNFTVSPWNTEYTTVTNNNGVAPDGTSTAATFIPTAVNNFHRTAIGWSSVTGYGNGIWTVSMFVKPYGYSYVSLRFDDGVTSVLGTTFNLSGNGTTSTGYYDANSVAGTPLSSSITPVGNGWYRIAITTRVLVYTNVGLYFHVMSNATTSSFTADGASGVYIWGTQVEQGYGATSYIPTAGSAVTRAADVTGVVGSGLYTLGQLENQTTTDDQFTIQSFPNVGSNYNWTCPEDVASVEVLVVAGGGSGGGGSGAIGAGGGGAGGIIYNTSYSVVPGTTYTVVVGAGGVGANRIKGTNGSNSQFGALVALGGGAGASDGSISNVGTPGGSGGGGGGRSGIGAPGTAGQGYSGSNGAANAYYAGGAGGGAGGPATPFFGSVAGSGGPGLYFNISGTSTAYGGGGGGGGSSYSSVSTAGTGGVGGGGAGTSTSINGVAGTANTGGGGGASGWSTDSGSILGGNGGSGIVIVKYKRTPRQISSTSNAAVVVQKFSTTNLWTVPAGVTQVEALVVAGGGGGGYGRDVTNIGSYGAGGGGAGGLVYSSALTVTPGSTYAIGVGTGGLGAQGTTGAANQGYSGFGSGIGTGTELITNGSAFTVTTGWTATTATLSVPQTGTFRITPNVSVNGTASQSITTVNGTTYVAVVKVTSDLSKQFRLRIGTTQVGNEITDFFTGWTNTSLDNGTTGSGFYSTTFTATGSTTWINMQVGGGTQQPTDISYISVRQATLPATGGGGGGGVSNSSTYQSGLNGGSGGGAGSWNPANGTPGSAVSGQGNAGGTGITSGASAGEAGGGGGGAGGAGANATFVKAGNGGTGLPYNITGNLEYYAGGGGGGSDLSATLVGQGGLGGGGGGNANGLVGGNAAGANGAPNTGGGGGGAGASSAGGSGGSGVVILRYRVPQVATFLDSGAWTCPAGVTSVQALVVAGGGGGGAGSTGSQLGGGGGGAGGLIYSSSVTVTPGQTYSVVVGQGGMPGITLSSAGTNGQQSSFSNLIAIGGGYGGVRSVSEAGGSGGSGGAGAGNPVLGGTGTYGQGNNGAGSQIGAFGGGGGGAGAVGSAGQASTEPTGGSGGIGLQFSIGGTAIYYAGGGSSGAWGGDQIVPASLGGGGAGGPTRTSGYPGLQNTGGGGGGSGSGYRNVSVDTAATKNGAHGGSGIVIIRYYGG